MRLRLKRNKKRKCFSITEEIKAKGRKYGKEIS